MTYAYSGAPEPVAVDQDRAGKVLLVTLDAAADGTRSVKIEQRQVGKTTFEKVEVDAATISRQPALVERLVLLADPDLVLDVRLTGVQPDELDIDTDEVERALARAFLKVRVRDLSVPALSGTVMPAGRHDPGRVHPRHRGAIAERPRRPRPGGRRGGGSATSCGSAGSCSPATR